MHAVSAQRPVAPPWRRVPLDGGLRLAPLVAALILCAGPAVGQPGAMITDLRLEEEGVAVTDPAILALIDTRPGEPLSITDVRRSETHLMALNRLESVDVLEEPFAGGVRLIYRLEPAHRIDTLVFEGRLALDADLLRREVRDRFGTAPLRASRVEAVVALLRTVYEDHGYPAARIETGDPIARHVPVHRATLVVRIDAGPRAVIRRIDWVQPSDEADPAGERPDLREGQPYDRQAIGRALDRWVQRMRERRYYEAAADDPLVAFEDGGAVVTLALRQGPQVRVEFTGDPLTRSEQERLVPVRTEASVDEDLLENWGFAIENYLRTRGYRDAAVTHTSRASGAAEQTIIFDVTKGPRYVIGALRVEGNEVRADADLREELGLAVGDPFVESGLEAGASVIAESYRTRGFMRVDVAPSADLVEPEQADAPERRMEVVVTVAEGPRTLVRAIAFSGNAVLPDAHLRGVMALAEGDPLSARALADSIASIVLEYRNLGYESVAVQPPRVEPVEGDQTRADVTIVVAEGPQVFVDRIIVEGNARISRETIVRELVLQEGAPLGYTARFASQTRLSGLGLFRRVRILDRPHVTDDRRDLVVQVEEALPTTIGYGGGLEISSRLRATDDGLAEERLEFVPRGFFEIGRRNMWGKNRSVSLFTRISARSRDQTVHGRLDTSYGVNEYRVYGTFREPRVFGSAVNILVTGIAERAIRTSYSFVTREVRAEMAGQLSPVYSGSLLYSIERTTLFDVDPNLDPDELPLIDRLFPQVRLSKVSATLIRNTRDDDLDPSEGTFVSADGEVAARLLGSEVGYLKGFVQGSWYRLLPFDRRVVLALRAALGAAHAFPRDVPVLGQDGQPLVDENGRETLQVIEDLPASERFFAGGSTTNRGFSTDQLGDESTISSNGFPTGGNGEILLNGEVRVGLFRALTGVVFFDTGNVFKRAADLSFTNLRPAAGFGFHYRSFIGPVRAEMGFNLDRRELSPGRLERGNVLHISLGPAF